MMYSAKEPATGKKRKSKTATHQASTSLPLATDALLPNLAASTASTTLIEPPPSKFPDSSAESADDDDEPLLVSSTEDTTTTAASARAQTCAPHSIVGSQTIIPATSNHVPPAGFTPEQQAALSDLPKASMNNTKYAGDVDCCKITADDSLENLNRNIKKALDAFNALRAKTGLPKLGVTILAKQRGFKIDCTSSVFEELLKFVNETFKTEKIYNSTLNLGKEIQPITDEVRQELAALQAVPKAQIKAPKSPLPYSFWGTPAAQTAQAARSEQAYKANTANSTDSLADDAIGAGDIAPEAGY
jgi:hypothetical protein